MLQEFTSLTSLLSSLCSYVSLFYSALSCPSNTSLFKPQSFPVFWSRNVESTWIFLTECQGPVSFMAPRLKWLQSGRPSAAWPRATDLVPSHTNTAVLSLRRGPHMVPITALSRKGAVIDRVWTREDSITPRLYRLHCFCLSSQSGLSSSAHSCVWASF